jgi:hypothetical protein
MEEHEFIDDSPVVDECMTRDEVAKLMGVSTTLVRRIELQALEKVRKRLLFHPRLEEIQEHTWERPHWLPRMF